jgi:hypothetical protein
MKAHALAKSLLPSTLIAGTLGFALLLAANRAAAAPPSRAAGAATPEGAWEQARTAYERGDFHAYIESVSPQARDEEICHITFLMSMAWGNGESGRVPLKEQQANEILRRYGMTELPPTPDGANSKPKPGLFGRQAIHLIEDKVGFYGEMMTYLSSNRIGPRVPAWLSEKLTDVNVEGTKATANRMSKFGAIGFDKLDNAWFIHPPAVCLDDLFRDKQTEPTSDQRQ